MGPSAPKLSCLWSFNARWSPFYSLWLFLDAPWPTWAWPWQPRPLSPNPCQKWPIAMAPYVRVAVALLPVGIVVMVVTTVPLVPAIVPVKMWPLSLPWLLWSPLWNLPMVPDSARTENSLVRTDVAPTWDGIVVRMAKTALLRPKNVPPSIGWRILPLCLRPPNVTEPFAPWDVVLTKTGSAANLNPSALTNLPIVPRSLCNQWCTLLRINKFIDFKIVSNVYSTSIALDMMNFRR